MYAMRAKIVISTESYHFTDQCFPSTTSGLWAEIQSNIEPWFTPKGDTL